MVSAWFDAIVIDRRVGDGLMFTTSQKLHAKWISANYDQQLLDVCRDVIPGIRAVSVVFVENPRLTKKKKSEKHA